VIPVLNVLCAEMLQGTLTKNAMTQISKMVMDVLKIVRYKLVISAQDLMMLILVKLVGVILNIMILVVIFVFLVM
jgi:hypothetical protein